MPSLRFLVGISEKLTFCLASARISNVPMTSLGKKENNAKLN